MRNLFILIFISLCTIAKGQNLKLGNPAPPIVINEWLKNGTDEQGKPIDLKNKFIVLEFWATWCGPCIRAIPHINDLQSKFGSDSVVFVSVSRETKEKILAFVGKKEMRASIGWDASGRTQSNYGVSSIPAAFLINKNGVLVWKGHPATLSEETLGTIIETENNKKFTDEPGKPLFGLNIKQSSSEFEFSEKEANWNTNTAVVKYENYTVLDMVLDVMQVKPHRAHVVGAVNPTRYDINFFYNAAALPGTMNAQAFFLNALMSAFEVRVSEGVVDKEVWVLRVPDDFKGDPNVSSSNDGNFNVVSNGNSWILQSVSQTEIASLFENELNTIVLPYASSNTTKYNLSLASAPSRDIDLIKKELETRYGIKLYKEVRKMNMTVIQFL